MDITVKRKRFAKNPFKNGKDYTIAEFFDGTIEVTIVGGQGEEKIILNKMERSEGYIQTHEKIDEEGKIVSSVSPCSLEGVTKFMAQFDDSIELPVSGDENSRKME